MGGGIFEKIMLWWQMSEYSWMSSKIASTTGTTSRDHTPKLQPSNEFGN